MNQAKNAHWLTQARQFFDTLAPVVCLSCGVGGEVLCASCSRSLARVRPVVGRARIGPQSDAAGSEGVPAVAGAIYAETVRDSIVGLKRTGSAALYRLLVPVTARALLLAVEAASPRRPVAVVPVASGAKTRRGFGGNLVRSLLVDSLDQLVSSGQLDYGRKVEIHDHLQARRVKGSQKWQSSGGRHVNVHGALKGTKVESSCATTTHLIFDDVVTTGSTVSEAARALAHIRITVESVVCVAARPRALGLPMTR